MRTTLITVGAALALSVPALAGPTFVLSDVGGAGAGTQVQTAFATAAGLWSSVFSNNVTVRLEVGFQNLGSGILGETNSNSRDVAYSTFRAALTRGATSADDRSAVASLAPTLSFMSNTPNGGTASATTHVLENNQANRDTQFLSVDTAEQKALGLISATDTRIDATIILNSNTYWTFDATQGVAKGFDFVGVALHEIGHALGFESGVDVADGYAAGHSSGIQQLVWGTPLDLFRYDPAGVRDWTAGGTPCLSVDGGKDCGAHFSTGESTGDHYQASHWKNERHPLGIMNPSTSPRQKLSIGPNDLQALDVIGWNLAPPGVNTDRITWGSAPQTPNSGTAYNSVATPEPDAIALLGLGIGGVTFARRRSV